MSMIVYSDSTALGWKPLYKYVFNMSSRKSKKYIRYKTKFKFTRKIKKYIYVVSWKSFMMDEYNDIEYWYAISGVTYFWEDSEDVYCLDYYDFHQIKWYPKSIQAIRLKWYLYIPILKLFSYSYLIRLNYFMNCDMQYYELILLYW